MAQQPNFFQLSGDGINISYSKTSLGGRPTFHYYDGTIKKDFLGEQIKAEDTVLGTLVSVTIEMTPDRGSTTFTVLIPRINLRETGPTEVDTQGITTEHRITLGGPVMPQLETYTVHPLKGKAEFRVD